MFYISNGSYCGMGERKVAEKREKNLQTAEVKTGVSTVMQEQGWALADKHWQLTGRHEDYPEAAGSCMTSLRHGSKRRSPRLAGR